MRTAWIALAMILASVSSADAPKGGGTAERGPPVEINIANETRKDEYPTKDAPLPVTVLQSAEDAKSAAESERRTREYEKSYLDTQVRLVNYSRTALCVSGIGALIAFLALVFLWRTYRETRNAAVAARDQVTISREEFNYMHRPHLVVRRERILHCEKDSGINFVLTNIGQLKASNMVGHFSVKSVPKSELDKFTEASRPQYGDRQIEIGPFINRAPHNSVDLGADQRVYIYVPAPDIFTERQKIPENIINGENALVFFGYIEFIGPDKKSGQVGFFRTYDPNSKSGKFDAREDDPDYEYSS
jgi:hypothetical protein